MCIRDSIIGFRGRLPILVSMRIHLAEDPCKPAKKYMNDILESKASFKGVSSIKLALSFCPKDKELFRRVSELSILKNFD